MAKIKFQILVVLNLICFSGCTAQIVIQKDVIEYNSYVSVAKKKMSDNFKYTKQSALLENANFGYKLEYISKYFKESELSVKSVPIFQFQKDRYNTFISEKSCSFLDIVDFSKDFNFQKVLVYQNDKLISEFRLTNMSAINSNEILYKYEYEGKDFPYIIGGGKQVFFPEISYTDSFDRFDIDGLSGTFLIRDSGEILYLASNSNLMKLTSKAFKKELRDSNIW